MKENYFDYFIFIDYSEDLLGYMIIKQDKLKELIPKSSYFKHYKDLKNKSSYLHSISERIKKEGIEKLIIRKIKCLRETPELYADLVEFIKKNENCKIFISVDNKQFSNFERLVNNIDGKKYTVVKESQLKKSSKEYNLSLILDTLLNLKRTKC